MNKFCDECLHYSICEKEGKDDPAMVFCDDRIAEAIPVEWMRKFANERALNDGMDCYWHFWGEDLFQMIEHWRKENGSREVD